MTIDIEKLIEDIDEDGSGEIEYDEFMSLLSSSDWIIKNKMILKVNSFTLYVSLITFCAWLCSLVLSIRNFFQFNLKIYVYLSVSHI